jgi:hypothetical protein
MIILPVPMSGSWHKQKVVWEGNANTDAEIADIAGSQIGNSRAGGV